MPFDGVKVAGNILDGDVKFTEDDIYCKISYNNQDKCICIGSFESLFYHDRDFEPGYINIV